MNKKNEQTSSSDVDELGMEADESLLDSEEIEKEEPKQEEVDSDGKEVTFDELKKENEILSDKMMRALAETENIRKKFFKEKKDAEIYGGTKLARDLLSVLDNLNRALESVDNNMRDSQSAFFEGIELTRKELLSTFSNHEINEVVPQIGEKFDPKFHQAMFEGPHSEIDKGNIIKVMAGGFTIGDRLLRAAQVGVSSGLIKNEDRESS
ncbi:nucleotide exchange factor GrpE [Paracoccaceae bacterium]|nr:nucleotide exchange factor GrpE [Paracoccaceae bacterium]